MNVWVAMAHCGVVRAAAYFFDLKVAFPGPVWCFIGRDEGVTALALAHSIPNGTSWPQIQPLWLLTHKGIGLISGKLHFSKVFSSGRINWL